MAVDFTTASDVIAGTLSRQELGMTLLLIFGATALVLAAIGIYGVIVYASAQREGELATRIALGATSSGVFRLMLLEGQRMGAFGVIVGVFVATPVAAWHRPVCMRCARPIRSFWFQRRRSSRSSR